MTEHTWEHLHSSTNKLSCGDLQAMITGFSSSPERALISAQIHFRMLLRMVGLVTDQNEVIGYIPPVGQWPDASLS